MLHDWGHDPARLSPSPPLKPTADVADVPALISLLNTDEGGLAAEVLATNSELIDAALPHVLQSFRQSLAMRLDSSKLLLLLSSRKAEINLRASCLRFFYGAGPHAFDATEDLLSLLVRHATEREYAGRVGTLVKLALVSVCWENPAPLIELLHHERPFVRAKTVWILRAFTDSAAQIGPALESLIADDDREVAHQTLSALMTLRWSNTRVIEALKERIQHAKYPRKYERALEVLEPMATE